MKRGGKTAAQGLEVETKIYSLILEDSNKIANN